MYSILKIIDWNGVWEGNLENISDFLCGSGHVIPKHAQGVVILYYECDYEFRITKETNIDGIIYVLFENIVWLIF